MIKKISRIFIGLCIGFSVIAGVQAQAVQEAPDVLVKRLSKEIFDTAKNDKEIQAGNLQRLYDMVEKKISPFTNFSRMTALAAGQYWRYATTEQQKQLIAEFRPIFIRFYSFTFTQNREQAPQLRPVIFSPEDTEVVVNSLVYQLRGEPLQLNYRLEKTSAGWMIYDANSKGAWFVDTYKPIFAAEISKNGIDGLINSLNNKNKKEAPAAVKK